MHANSLHCSQISAGSCGFVKHIGYWVGRLICPSHRGLDIISLCFPQLAQASHCTPQDCIVKQRSLESGVVAGRPRMRKSRKDL